MRRPAEMNTQAASISCSLHKSSLHSSPHLVSSRHKSGNSRKSWGIGSSATAERDSIAFQHLWMTVLLPRNKRRLKPIRSSPPLQPHYSNRSRSQRSHHKSHLNDSSKCISLSDKTNRDETETTSPTGDMSSRSTLWNSPMETTSRIVYAPSDRLPLPPLLYDDRSSPCRRSCVPLEIVILRTTSPTRIDVETSAVRSDERLDDSMDAYIGDAGCRSEASLDLDDVLTRLEQLDPAHGTSPTSHPLRALCRTNRNDAAVLPAWTSAPQHDSVWGITTTTLDDELVAPSRRLAARYHWQSVRDATLEWPSDEDGSDCNGLHEWTA